MIFFLSQEVGEFFSPRGWVIFFCPEGLGDFFFVLRGFVIFFFPGGLGDFFRSRGVACFFVPRGCVFFSVPRGCMIFFLHREVASSQVPKFSSSTILDTFGAILNPFMLFEAISSYLEPFSVIWNYLNYFKLFRAL